MHLWFWPSVPLMARKVVLAPLTMQTVEDRKVELESLPSLMSFDAAVALEIVTLDPFWSSRSRPRTGSPRIGILNALFALRTPRAVGAACGAGRSLAPRGGRVARRESRGGVVRIASFHMAPRSQPAKRCLCFVGEDLQQQEQRTWCHRCSPPCRPSTSCWMASALMCRSHSGSSSG